MAPSIDFGVHCGDLAKVKRLLKKDPSLLNARLENTENSISRPWDSDGATPLHVACCQRNEKIAKFLLEQGANIEQKDGRGETALHYACDSRLVGIVLMILARRPLSNDPAIWETLRYASLEGHVEVLRSLLHHCTDSINIIINKGN